MEYFLEDINTINKYIHTIGIIVDSDDFLDVFKHDFYIQFSHETVEHAFETIENTETYEKLENQTNKEEIYSQNFEPNIIATTMNDLKEYIRREDYKRNKYQTISTKKSPWYDIIKSCSDYYAMAWKSFFDVVFIQKYKIDVHDMTYIYFNANNIIPYGYTNPYNKKQYTNKIPEMIDTKNIYVEFDVHASIISRNYDAILCFLIDCINKLHIGGDIIMNIHCMYHHSQTHTNFIYALREYFSDVTLFYTPLWIVNSMRNFIILKSKIKNINYTSLERPHKINISLDINEPSFKIFVQNLIKFMQKIQTKMTAIVFALSIINNIGVTNVFAENIAKIKMMANLVRYNVSD